MTKTIRPAPGCTIRRPEHGFRLLPAKGMPVDWNPYWERLLARGDVELVPEEAPDAAAGPAVEPPVSKPKKGSDA